MFKRIRILILLFILATVALGAYRAESRNRSWENTLQVAVYPINADGSAASTNFIARLGRDDLSLVEDYFQRQSERHGLSLQRPIRLTLAQPVASLPPVRPATASALAAIQWTLALRYWAWRHSPDIGFEPDIRLYVLYHDPAQNERVPDSTGLAKGQLAVVHQFARSREQGSNLVVLSHELLHTLGATDLYDPANSLPLYPEGYAEPEKTPRYPQNHAELMAGRIPVTETQADIPLSLRETLVGRRTAHEIGWLK